MDVDDSVDFITRGFQWGTAENPWPQQLISKANFPNEGKCHCLGRIEEGTVVCVLCSFGREILGSPEDSTLKREIYNRGRFTMNPRNELLRFLYIDSVGMVGVVFAPSRERRWRPVRLVCVGVFRDVEARESGV